MDMDAPGPHLTMTAADPCWVRLHGAVPELLAEVRAGIKPRSHRRYSDSAQVWEFHWHWLPQVVAWSRARYARVTWADLPAEWQLHAAGANVGGQISATEELGPSPFAVLHLMEDAPQEVVAAAYKALARINHPDVGGDPERFKKIAAAYQEIHKLKTSCGQLVS